MFKNPIVGQVYTYVEIETGLRLSDTPHLLFNVNGQLAVIQNSHVTVSDMLAIPGMDSSRWKYHRTTHEAIPVFHAEDDAAILALVDVEPSTSPYDDPGSLWVTPKGHYREQFDWSEHVN